MKKLSILLVGLLVGLVVGAVDIHLQEIYNAGPVKVMRTTNADMDVSMGHYGNRFYVNKFGHNDDVDAAEDIWHGGGEYTGFPLADVELIEVVSSDVNDTSAGTGCRTVGVFGLDANYEMQNEMVSLNGTTPVDTVNTYTRSYRSYCATAGSGATNAGAITVRHTTTTANVFGILEAGIGQTQNSVWTVPANHFCYIRTYEISLSDNTANKAEVAIWIRTFGGAERLVNHFNVSTAFHSPFVPFGADPIPEKTDLKMRVTSVQNANAHANFTGAIMCVRDE